MSDNFKETTFTKIVERTCKRDAYQRAFSWANSPSATREDILWWLKQKIDGHNEFLAEQPLRYEYTTQSLEPKK